MFYVSGSGKGVDGVKGTLVWHFFFIFLGGDEFFSFYFLKKKPGIFKSLICDLFFSIGERYFLEAFFGPCFGTMLWTFSLLDLFSVGGYLTTTCPLCGKRTSLKIFFSLLLCGLLMAFLFC